MIDINLKPSSFYEFFNSTYKKLREISNLKIYIFAVLIIISNLTYRFTCNIRTQRQKNTKKNYKILSKILIFKTKKEQ